MSEEWRPIPDHPDYEVSDQGRVRSWKMRSTDHCRPSEPRILTPKRLNSYGHKFFEVWNRGQRTKFSIHRTVLTLFVGPYPKGKVACHNNGDPSDNRLSNLRWDTMKNNQQDMVAHGRSQRGAKNSKVRLTERDLHIIERMMIYLTEKQVADVFQVSPSAISSVIHGRTWRHVA